MNVRAMRPDEIDAAVSVWREANVARGAPHGPARIERIRAKLSALDALPFIAFRPDIVGMALAEPGRFDDGAGDLDPTLLHISMVFVRPPAQRTGVGLPLVMHVLDVARSSGYRRVSVWTAQENTAARKLYERAGMTPTGKTTPLRSSVALQYEFLVEESRRRDLGVDDVADLWAEVTPALENESLELAGEELRAMRRERHTREGQSESCKGFCDESSFYLAPM